MAIVVNKIGSHQFISLQGYAVPPYMHQELDARPGVDGIAITKTAKHGDPFRLVSAVDCASYELAEAEYDTYVELCDEDPVELVKDGVSSLPRGYRVQVLGVTQLECRRILTPIGGLNSPSEAWLACAWDLVAVADEDEVD